MKKPKKSKPFGYIYLIICCLNDMEYVGQTTQTVEARFNQHCRCHGTHIDNAILSYGKENFLVITLEECNSQAELDAAERRIIFAKGCKEPFGYNVKDGGKGFGEQSGKNSPFYGKPSPFRKSVYPNLLEALTAVGFTTYSMIGELLNLTKDTIKQKMHGDILFTDEQQDFLADYLGKPIEYLFARSDGKSSVSNYHKPPSEETKQKIRDSTSGEKNHFFNKKHANETIQKISEVQRDYCPYKNLLAEMIKLAIVSYAALAELMGISLPNISRKMGGKMPFTKKDKAKLVAIFNKPIEYLLEREDGVIFLPTSHRGENHHSYGKPSPLRKTVYPNLLEALVAVGITTYAAFGTLINLSYKSIQLKMHGKVPFTDKQKTFLADYLGKPVEYLFTRVDG